MSISSENEQKIISNSEYKLKIQPFVIALHAYQKKTQDTAKEVIGENLMDFDLCFCGLMDRSIRLTEGFIPMLEARNLTCAGALLRLMIDNCLRSFALMIAADEQQAINCILEGGELRKLKDKSGKSMTDKNLKEQIKEYDSLLPTVYDNTSGFIHFSEKAVYQSIYNTENNRISLQVGGELNEKRNANLLECASAYLHYYQFFLKFMEAEADWKKEFDNSNKMEKRNVSND